MDKLFKISQKILSEHLPMLRMIVPDKPLLPSFGFIRFYSVPFEEKPDLYIEAHNSENSIRIIIKGEDIFDMEIYDQDMDIGIDASFLPSLVNRDIDISFSKDENRCIIESIGSVIKVPFIAPEEFIKFPVANHPLFEMPSVEFTEVMKTIIPFTNKIKESSTGCVHFVADKDTLSIGAINQFSSCSYSKEFENLKDFKFLLSQDSSQLVSSYKGINPCTVVYSNRDYIFDYGNITISCRAMNFQKDVALNFHQLSKQYTERPSDLIGIPHKGIFTEQIERACIFSYKENNTLSMTFQDEGISMVVEDYLTQRSSEQSIECLANLTEEKLNALVDYKAFHTMIKGVHVESFDMMVPTSHGQNINCINSAIYVLENSYVFMIMPMAE